MQKNITICADDYGMSLDINRAITALLEKGTINATSCMVNMPYFISGVALLKKHSTNAKIGLHLNLTEGKPLSGYPDTNNNGKFHSLSNILIKSHLRKLNYNSIYNELKAQLSAFITSWGVLPDFLDGHQHIHHFPTIRKAIIALYKEFNLKENDTYIRSVRNIKRPNFKSQVIYFSGAKKFESMLQKARIKYNSNFSGIYSLDNNDVVFRGIILKSYAEIKDGGLIMCHPCTNLNKKDPIGESRLKEYLYFNSDQARKDQLDNNIYLKDVTQQV